MSEIQNPVTVEEITVAASPERWSGAGFRLEADGSCRVGPVRIRLAREGAGRGVVGWSLRGLAPDADLDGLPPTVAHGRARRTPAGAAHPNGVVALDHVVALTPALDRTVAALERAGLDLRRIREEPLPGGGVRQAFFRLDPAILEVIEQPTAAGPPVDPSKPARLWGLAFSVDDLDRSAARLGDLLGDVRDAIQPGRRIATVHARAELGAAIALMSARPPSGG